ncbi:Endolytic murein transglycosylase [Massilia sp. Bi118]|uniref:endolytic transglycosylase MltG n=1 Tax=Massilia sp. Bi118 TaxID=2822346 RepID=UPI001D53EEFE|nr:endolytic transglycosylase MltG [Massilia sp. Bi118]CAH0194115.1 Endolytic murein transglycosylase [Massilia sp. Bi118]
MALIRKLIITGVIVSVAAVGGFQWWSGQPITPADSPVIPFAIAQGSHVGGAAQQMATAGVPVNGFLFGVLARVTGKASQLKAGSYELKPGTTPRRLIAQLVRGEFAQESLTIIEGWTFRQMRQAVDAAPNLKHETAKLSDKELLEKIVPEANGKYATPEGLFFPDTYLFAKNSSDLQIYKQAHEMMMKRLKAAWEKREPNLPYTDPYQALIMASLVEKETGQKSERAMIAGVFVNRLKTGMLLQTDPTVIYGMGEKYDGKIRKKDLETDTPYNTYTRAGLPPTPIALPGVQSLAAALMPAKTDALYFVSRGDGTSHFSVNLNEHNKAVNQYQRQGSK